MDLPTILGMIGAGIALVLAPIWLLIVVKGVRSLSDIRDMLTRPPGERAPAQRGRPDRTADRR